MNKQPFPMLRAMSVLWLCCCVLLTTRSAVAEQKLRVQVDQRGDFVLIGNTLGWDCGAGAAAPVVGTADNSIASFFSCGLLSTDTSPDLFWRADAPADGQALASTTTTAADARTTAVLALPNGATVTHAFLYWGARRTGTAADTTATFERPGAFSKSVTAVASYLHQVGADAIYQSVADVTSLVLAGGSGAYRVSGIDARSFPDAAEDVLFGGWALFVLYQLDGEPMRNLAVFDGLDSVDQLGATSSVALSGFLVPMAGFDAKLGTLVYEGDNVITGDSLRFGTAPLDASHDLTDAQNPASNFFNGTRSHLGQPVSVVGDLPQLAGTASTLAGMDLDVIDVTSRVKAGQTAVDLQAVTFLDAYFMGAFITSISTFRPDFIFSEKSVRDVNGSASVAGDELEYTITVENTGNDASANTVVEDPLPSGVSFVSGSLVIGSGVGAYDAAAHQLTAYVGDGATTGQGGSIAAGASTTLVFRVTIDMGTTGVISNQASITAAGKRGAPAVTTLTDGNGSGPGNTPTETPTGECTIDTQCTADRPICDVSTGVCVQCTNDTECAGATATCDPNTHTCVCNASFADCMDTDGDGLSDPEEVDAGTDPTDRDSDDDGTSDGAEPDWNKDSDGDGLINALDPDSDGDGLPDGLENGKGCDAPATDVSKGLCKADGDLGATTTSSVKADTDDGGVHDGEEDANKNGVVDSGERDPNRGCDDPAPSTCEAELPEPGAEPTSNLRSLAGGGCSVATHTRANIALCWLLLAAALLLGRRRRR